MTDTTATPAQPAGRARWLLPLGIALACAAFLVAIVAAPGFGKVIFWPLENLPRLAWFPVAAALLIGVRFAHRRGHGRLAIVLGIAAAFSLIPLMIFFMAVLQEKGWPPVLAFILPLGLAVQIFNEVCSSAPAKAPASAPPASGHVTSLPPEFRPATTEPQLPPPWQAR